MPPFAAARAQAHRKIKERAAGARPAQMTKRVCGHEARACALRAISLTARSPPDIGMPATCAFSSIAPNRQRIARLLAQRTPNSTEAAPSAPSQQPSSFMSRKSYGAKQFFAVSRRGLRAPPACRSRARLRRSRYYREMKRQTACASTPAERRHAARCPASICSIYQTPQPRCREQLRASRDVPAITSRSPRAR